MSEIRRNSDALRRKISDRERSVDFAWSDGSRFRGRFGFKFGMHVINYPCCGEPLNPDESSLGNVAYRFRTTRWTAVLLSAQSQAPGYQAALGELYRIYWYPLYAYIRRRGHTPEEAQDLTQGFFLHLLEHKTLGRADPLKGKVPVVFARLIAKLSFDGRGSGPLSETGWQGGVCPSGDASRRGPLPAGAGRSAKRG